MSPSNAFHKVATKAFKNTYTLVFLSLYHNRIHREILKPFLSNLTGEATIAFWFVRKRLMNLMGVASYIHATKILMGHEEIWIIYGDLPFFTIPFRAL